jgi:phosphatidylserine decarboxylase
VQELAMLIDGDPLLRMDLTRALTDAIEAGHELGYSSSDELMDIVDYLMTYAPPFSEAGLIHCPLNAVLDWPMCMPSGYALFRDPVVNAKLKQVLNVWSGFLNGPYSREYLNSSAPEGWLSPEAQDQLGLSQFVCDPDKPHWGFESWTASSLAVSFPTRDQSLNLRIPKSSSARAKPLHTISNTTSNSATASGLNLNPIRWRKCSPRERELARQFVGGSVCQAFLSAFNYHRWHAPVSGRIVKAYHVDGSYYSEAESEGIDPGGLNDSPGYTTAVAARAVIVIDCDDPAIGLVGCVFVGMADVSSCVVEALPGQQVAKGDELGYFQYGGSTYCLVFRPDVVQSFAASPPFDDEAPPIKVSAHAATAR